jgi:hypothetical protein
MLGFFLNQSCEVIPHAERRQYQVIKLLRPGVIKTEIPSPKIGKSTMQRSKLTHSFEISSGMM